MANKNDFKPFAIGAGANVTPQADWEALAALDAGFQSGKASSAQVNKALRQGTFVASALAQFISNKLAADVIDDGDLSGFVTDFINAIKAQSLTRDNPFADIKADDTVDIALENLGLGDSVLLSQFSSLRNGSGYRKLPDGTIKMWGIAITSSLAAGAGGAWSVSLPTAFPNAMLSASASLAMGASAGGMWVSVMDVGTPFNGTTDTKLPASKQTTIYGSVFNGLANSTKALIRWECEGY